MNQTELNRFPALFEVDGDSENMSMLEISLINRWKEMDKMLYCIRIPKCVKQKTNLLQNIILTLDKIKQLSVKLEEKKR